MPRSTRRHSIRLSARLLLRMAAVASLAGLGGALSACVTRPDAKPTDDDLDKWYVHCRLHDTPWCLGPFRRSRDAEKAGWEHEFWLHMSQNTTRTDHEPCQSTP